MCHWEARPKLQVHKRSAMQLKTRLVRLPDDRLALARTGGCRRGRCKCGYVYEPNLETGIDLPLASSSTRSPDSHRASKLASKMRCACSLSWGRVPADRDRHARFCQCQLSDGLCTLSEGAAGAPAGRSSLLSVTVPSGRCGLGTASLSCTQAGTRQWGSMGVVILIADCFFKT